MNTLQEWIRETDKYREEAKLNNLEQLAVSAAYTHLFRERERDFDGALKGAPISIKDNISIKGFPTRAGSAVSLFGEEKFDAPVVARLRSAGAWFTGHTVMNEFAYGASGLDRNGRTARRPEHENYTKITGGSSSGAAVSVSEESCLAAIGTDTAGSVRIPAAFNSLVGFLPSRCITPTDGILPLSQTLDRVGVIGKTIGDCKEVASFITNNSLNLDDDRSAPRIVVALPDEGDLKNWEKRSFLQSLNQLVEITENLGAKLVRNRLITDSIQCSEVQDVASTIRKFEVWRFHENSFLQNQNKYSEPFRRRMGVAENCSSIEYREAMEQRLRYKEEFVRFFESGDVILLPTLLCDAPGIVEVSQNESEWGMRLVERTAIVNLVDWCAITIPFSKTSDGTVSFTLAAPNGRDSSLISAATWIKRNVLDTNFEMMVQDLRRS